LYVQEKIACIKIDSSWLSELEWGGIKESFWDERKRIGMKRSIFSIFSLMPGLLNSILYVRAQALKPANIAQDVLSCFDMQWGILPMDMFYIVFGVLCNAGYPGRREWAPAAAGSVACVWLKGKDMVSMCKNL